MDICKLLDIEMPLHKICPVSKNFKKRFVCYRNCGFSSIRESGIIKKKEKRIIQTSFVSFIDKHEIKN